MKKLLSIITISLLIQGCDRKPSDFRNGAIITDIEKNNSQGCIYYTHTTVWFFHGLKRPYGYFCDDCGKFTVGDTIKLIKQ